MGIILIVLKEPGCPGATCRRLGGRKSRMGVRLHVLRTKSPDNPKGPKMTVPRMQGIPVGLGEKRGVMSGTYPLLENGSRRKPAGKESPSSCARNRGRRVT